MIAILDATFQSMIFIMISWLCCLLVTLMVWAQLQKAELSSPLATRAVTFVGIGSFLFLLLHFLIPKQEENVEQMIYNSTRPFNESISINVSMYSLIRELQHAH